MYFRKLSSIYSCLCSHPLTSAGREAVPLNPLLHTSVCSALSLPLWSIDRPRPVANGIQKTSGSLSRSYLFVTFFVLPLLLISSPPALREIAIPPFDRPLLQSPTLSPSPLRWCPNRRSGENARAFLLSDRRSSRPLPDGTTTTPPRRSALARSPFDAAADASGSDRARARARRK